MAFNTETAVTNKSGTSLDVALVSNSEISVINKSGTTLDVVVNPVVIEDTTIYSNDNISIASDESIETNLTIGTIIEVLTISMASLNNSNVYKIYLKSDVSFGSDLFIAYCVAGTQLTPNIRFTVPNHSDDNLYVNVEKLTGAGSSDVSISVTYRLTPP